MTTPEIKHAVKIHQYIEKLEELTNISLKTSPVILGAPSSKITFAISEYSNNSDEYVAPLYEDIGDHDLLFKAMRTGWSHITSCCNKIPKNQEKHCQHWNHSHALRIARERGYSVTNEFLRDQQVAYGEYEAYYAVREILYGNAPGIWLKKSNFDNFIYNYAVWHKSVKLITSQFIIPSSNKQSTVPYILDQLWLISQHKNQVRLLGLEITGEHNIFNGGQSKTLGRDKYLKNLGYEMYRVASWWCRVDPYRVICEFLNVAGIFPDAIRYLIGSELDSIDKYICGICNAPMVRADWDWIQECQVGNSTVLAHKSCVIQRSGR